MRTFKSLIWLLAFLFLAVWSAGCAHGSQNLSDPVKTYKNEFLEKYGFFVSQKEKKEFDLLSSVEAVDRFAENFWKIRDTDPTTPENEYKQLIDSRIEDINKDAFVLDGIFFKANGGLRGDFAHVYLLYGMPHYMDKLPRNRSVVDLMVWYYFDQTGQHLFRFLFAERWGSYKVFRNHMILTTYDYLFDPMISPLREITDNFAPDQQQLFEAWMELERSDTTGAFRLALMEFSYYSDVRIDEALRAPDPAAFIAGKYKPSITGEPELPAETTVIEGSEKSYIPGKVLFSGSAGKYTVSTAIRYSDMDWEASGDELRASLVLTVSFRNAETKTGEEFMSGLKIIVSKDKLEMPKKNHTFNARLDGLPNLKGVSQETLGQLISRLKPGTYVINFRLSHGLTKKALVWNGKLTIN